MASFKFPQSVLLVCIALTAACSGKSAAPASAAAPAQNPVTSLQTVTLKPGTGATIGGGQIAVVQYTGWLYEAGAADHKGKQFDSSRNAGQPFKFALDTGAVIKGWDQGVIGMKVGESRRLVIPPELAYGDSGAGGVIPPGATLVFDVELVGIE
ncbi:MAG TPA: FKBP-type peptidyl-prolyl cis-trans isomerase [Steroidobacteraceae bacterium]|jgi:FKBP-type peptidyl-prolyl cis-trans isomerase FkpA|nr:FKBP-type peptidyl-prolyl cis-trans isomerase [Steroidobacteraceae bacterium]